MMQRTRWWHAGSGVRRLAAALAALAVLAGLALGLGAPAAAAPNDWRVGNPVDLSAGTQIRQGPGFNYCFHTIVPEDAWRVVVTNGPLRADGRTWYDTSRKAAGDPSGGTGWVNIEQVDGHLGRVDGGLPCPGSQAAQVAQPSPPPPRATPTPGIDGHDGGILDFLRGLLRWWGSQPVPVKIGIVALALILLPVTMRLQALGSRALVGALRAILWGIALGGAADLTRAIWEPNWLQVAGQFRVLDPALILALLPLGWFAFGYLAGVAALGVVIGALIVVGLFILLYVYYLAALLRPPF